MKRITLIVFVICLTAILTACSKTQELTADQINQVNEAFTQLLPAGEDDNPHMSGPDGEFVLNPISHFFTSYYEKPEELDMGSFVYYIFRESYLTTEDYEEIEALKASGMDLPFENIEDSPVPFGRIPFSTVDEYLRTYANISLDEMTNMGDALYSEEYETFYSYASDFGPGVFHCISGEIKGDTVTLYSDDAVLTLKKDGDHYFIVSHLPIA